MKVSILKHIPNSNYGRETCLTHFFSLKLIILFFLSFHCPLPYRYDSLFGAGQRYTTIRVDIDVGRDRTQVPMRIVSIFYGVEVRGRAEGQYLMSKQTSTGME